MKKRNLWAMSLIGLALAACTQDEEINNAINQDAEGTVVSLKIDFAGAQTKAAGDLPVDGTDKDATEAESKVSSLTVVVTDADNGNVVKSVTTVGDGGLKPVSGQQNKYEFTVPKGTYKFYAFANSNKTTFTESQQLIPNQLEATYAEGSDYKSVYANNNFLMGNENGESTAFIIGNEPSYDVNITLERAAVKVTAKCENPTLTDGAQSQPKEVGKISDVRFLLNGLRQKTYLMAYNGSSNNKRTCPTESNYVFAQDENGDLQGGFSFTSIGSTSSQNPLYCLENTQTSYTDANTTYVVFNTKFVPAKVVELNSGKDNFEQKENTNYAGNTPASFYVINNGDWAGNYILKSYYDSNKTEIDKLVSLSAEFKGGTCYFAAPINKQGTSAPYAYPVFRNDWYDLSITAIKLPGSPNIPDLNLDGVDITLTTTVKGWNYVTKDVNLGE